MIYHIWLATTGISKKKACLLLSALGAEGVYEAPAEKLKQYASLSSRDLTALSDKSLKKAEKILKDCKLKGIDIITISDERYPQRLKEIYEPPLALYVRGVLPEIDKYPAFAVVGSRYPERESVSFAEKTAGELAKEGFLIVSGLAKGIDGVSHRAALSNGFPTVAVLGTAIDRIYPAENINLAYKIEKSGAIISENPPGAQTFPSDFRVRNRIISGLSIGVLVVQAGGKSGSLNTANFALEQNRDVFVMPGQPGNEAFSGSNALIKDGACLTTDASDIISSYQNALKSLKRAERKAAPDLHTASSARALSPDEQKLYDLSDGKRNIDGIIEESGLSAQKAVALLTFMELSGVIEQLPGQIYIKKIVSEE